MVKTHKGVLKSPRNQRPQVGFCEVEQVEVRVTILRFRSLRHSFLIEAEPFRAEEEPSCLWSIVACGVSAQAEPLF